LDPDHESAAGVDQPGGAAGEDGGAADDRLEAGVGVGELVEVADHPHGGTRVGVERGQPDGEILHRPIVLPRRGRCQG
jgi:hypothetical protein